MNEITETIAAVSTSSAGNGGIGIIRISGPFAVAVADKIFRAKSEKKLKECQSHTIHYGKIEEKGKMVDEVLVMLMRAPRTYTAQDVVEINCHGGMLVMNRILEMAIHAGARLAEPGEFTRRAFLNGRIDLSQAEAVMDVISARNEYALRASVAQLDGRLSEKVRELRSLIMDHIAFIEASLDDPEHINMDNDVEKLSKDVDNYVEKLEELCKSAENGRIIRNGIYTVILGKPNVGKSSFLNMLSQQERAIVTDVEGTTRDLLEEQINLDGILLNLVDTAGIRKTQDKVEQIGVERAKKAADCADLVVCMMDGSRPLDENDEEILKLARDKKGLLLLNKSDLENQVSPEALSKRTGFPVLSISAKTGEGMRDFSSLLKKMFYEGEIDANEEMIVMNLRHRDMLKEAKTSLLLVKKSIEDRMPEDLFSIDLMNAYGQLGKIIGEEVEEDLVNAIFSKFCMGK